jgi:hypothetical protein
MIEAGTEKVVGHIDFVAYLYSVITWNSWGSHSWWFNLNLTICQFYIPACNILHLFQVQRDKWQVPGILQMILSADVFLTQRFCNWADCYLPFQSLRLHYKVLEVSVTSYIFEMVTVSLCLFYSHDIMPLLLKHLWLYLACINMLNAVKFSCFCGSCWSVFLL